MNKKISDVSKYAIALASVAFGLGLLNVKEAGAVTFYQNFSSFDAVTNTTVVEDFESFPSGALPSFSSNGITYTGLTGTEGGVFFPNIEALSGGFLAPVDGKALAASGDEDFTIDFSTPTNTVGFDTHITQQFPTTVNVYGINGLLGTLFQSHDPNSIGFVGIVSDELITSVRWTSLGNPTGQNSGIDNLRVAATSVPEPASVLSLLVLGAIGSRSILKRRQQQ